MKAAKGCGTITNAMGKRRGLVLLLILVAAAALAGSVAMYWPMWTRDPIGPPKADLPNSVEGDRDPLDGRFVGHPEVAIVERFGPPSHRWRGHYGAPPIDYQRRYQDAITVTYVRPSGTLYLSFCKERGRLVCFTSHWMPEGSVF